MSRSLRYELTRIVFQLRPLAKIVSFHPSKGNSAHPVKLPSPTLIYGLQAPEKMTMMP